MYLVRERRVRYTGGLPTTNGWTLNFKAGVQECKLLVVVDLELTRVGLLHFSQIS